MAWPTCSHNNNKGVKDSIIHGQSRYNTESDELARRFQVMYKEISSDNILSGLFRVVLACKKMEKETGAPLAPHIADWI
jgi:hypothetical protein